MLSPADLLEIAEAFTNRIPLEPAYAEERDASLLLVGNGYLRLDDAAGAVRAAARLSHPAAAGELRVALAKWAYAHAESEIAREVVRETVEGVAELEPFLSRRDFGELTPCVLSVLGESYARRMVDALEDPFSRAIILCDWAEITRKAELVSEAEAIAMEFEYGDRDYALNCVMRGYQALGRVDDADRVGSLMSTPLDLIYAPVAMAEDAMAKAKLNLAEPPEPVDTPTNALSRYLYYRHNDLKVRWLVDQASRGGVNDLSLESQVESEAFRRLGPARQASLYAGISGLTVDTFAAYLFDRVIPLSRADEDLLQQGCFNQEDVDPARLVQLTTELCLDFGTLARKYSEQQVDQGIWLLLGQSLSLGEALMNEGVSFDARVECIEAMIVPFRDYCQHTTNEKGTAFFMWWDMIDIRTPEPIRVARNVLAQILDLPSWPCQKAAIHGLNHLWPDLEAAGIIDRYLETRREEIPADELRWVEFCRDGKMM